jgi:hypothetical protein
VLDQVPATHQHRAWWPVRRFQDMNNLAKLAVAAAAVVAIAFAGISLITPGGIAAPGPNATPVPTPSPSPAVFPASGSLAPGLYYMSDSRDVTSGRLVLTVPGPGWEANDIRMLRKMVAGSSATPAVDVAVSAWVVGNLKADPCKWHGGGVQPPVGPSVDDLATALAAQAGPSATATAATLGGYQGKKVEFSAPPGLDITTCDEGAFSRWQPADNPSDWGGFLFGAGQLNAVYILDVAGKRQVIDTAHLPGTSAANLAELDAVVASIRFEPRPSTSSPSASQ